MKIIKKKDYIIDMGKILLIIEKGIYRQKKVHLLCSASFYLNKNGRNCVKVTPGNTHTFWHNFDTSAKSSQYINVNDDSLGANILFDGKYSYIVVIKKIQK